MVPSPWKPCCKELHLCPCAAAGAAGPCRGDSAPQQSHPAAHVKPLCLCADLQVLRSSCPMIWSDPSPLSDLLQCIHGSALSSGTSSSLLTPSSKIPPCHPIQLPTHSPSWRKLAGGWRRRKKGLENSPLNKGMVIRSGCAWEGRGDCSEGGQLRDMSTLLWSPACSNNCMQA